MKRYDPNNPFQDSRVTSRERQASLNAFNFELFSLGSLDYEDPEAVRQRILDVFDVFAKYGEKINYVSFALGLGFNSRTKLDEIRNGTAKYPKNPDSVELIRRAAFIVESMWASMMQNGEINTLAAIYMGKNYFKMRDQADLTVTNTTPQVALTADQVRKKYGRLVIDSGDDFPEELANDLRLLQGGAENPFQG